MIEPYYKNLLRNMLRQIKQAASEGDVELVCELCDDIRAVFAAQPEVYDRAPDRGLTLAEYKELHKRELRPDTGTHETGPCAA